MFRQCPSPSKCRTDGCNSSQNTLLHGAERIFPAKPSTNNNINTSKSNAGTSWPSTGQQQPSKTTTLSSVTDVKGLLQEVHEDQDFEAFTVRPYVRETLNVGSDIIDVKSMQEIYPLFFWIQ